ncbi:sugar transferase, partial [Candidatus Shapirobacteria bacterium CG10_big_fil_rev_8_21_14_0_10_40_9]
MSVNPLSQTVYQKFGKRGIDILFSSLGIILLWPIFLIIAILIKLDSPGPVIFKQKRVGKDGEIFT